MALAKLAINFYISSKNVIFSLIKKKEWISEKAQKTFKNNMKIPSFKKQIDKIWFENSLNK